MSEQSGRETLIGAAVAAGRDRAFVGRQRELALFRAALAGTPGARPVHYLHGPGGIGKSTLLRRFAREAHDAGRAVVEVDGRTIPPTPEGLAAAAGGAAREPGVVLLVDTFERCQGLEGWLWERFLPQVPAGAVVVVAGREAPDPKWIADPGWTDLLGVTALRNLVPGDAAAFLRKWGVPPGAHEGLLSFTGGNPLALALAAAVAVKDETASPGWKPNQDVIATLLPQLIGDIPDPLQRKALEICAHAYITSESLLRALIGEDASQLFAWLRRQPYVESTAAGLFPHDAVREVLEADLRWRDPEGFSAMHQQMREHLLGRLRSVSETHLLQATGELTYLFRTDRRMAQFYGWREAGVIEDQPYAPDERRRVLELVEEAEGGRSASIASFWLDRQPEAFRVYRSTQTGELVACSAWLKLPEPEGADIDPVVATAWEHARACGPLRPGEHIGMARFSVHPPAHHRPSAPMTLIQWRAVGEWVRSGRLAWSYLVFRDDGFWNAHLHDNLMQPIASRPRVGDLRYALFCRDWRSAPAGPWLKAKSDAILTGSLPASRPQPAHGELAVLSRPEFDTAIRDALRTLRRPDRLAANPLNHSRLIVESGKGLAEVLTQAAEALLDERGGDKRHRAVIASYFKGAPTQEAAAERLGLPLSTFRRHLTSAVERMSDLLWRQELNGSAMETETGM
ncbi:AAA family ATPase [Streptomyces sp. 8N616]|uniref:AAA family ATPase n=1 Tax=Streptomyces sp. 8N616 TaxID=3457414 RepID=UPI003FD4660A